jgi:hypothetical protein
LEYKVIIKLICSNRGFSWKHNKEKNQMTLTGAIKSGGNLLPEEAQAPAFPSPRSAGEGAPAGAGEGVVPYGEAAN